MPKQDATNVWDVAAYIIEKCGPTPATKLQKLVYYGQAWSLVWDDGPLFSERIEAWAYGPVVRDLYVSHRKQYMIDKVPRGRPDKLNEDQRESLDVVIEFYSPFNAQQLSDLTHEEEPWKKARREAGLVSGQRGSAEITHDSMAWYYSSL